METGCRGDPLLLVCRTAEDFRDTLYYIIDLKLLLNLHILQRYFSGNIQANINYNERRPIYHVKNSYFKIINFQLLKIKAVSHIYLQYLYNLITLQQPLTKITNILSRKMENQHSINWGCFHQRWFIYSETEVLNTAKLIVWSSKNVRSSKF